MPASFAPHVPLFAAWPGADPTRDTVRLALLFYAVAVVLMPWLDAAARRASSPLGRLVRLCWELGCVAFLAHVALAFHHHHGWSHTEAVRHVAERAGFGQGIFLSYLFTLAWAADAGWWRLAPASHAGRPRWVGLALHPFLLFMVFNATVVFESGLVRWGGLVLATLVAGSFVLHLVSSSAWRKPVKTFLPLLVCLVCAGLVPAQTPDEKKNTVAYLQKLQTSEGGFRGDARSTEPTLRATSACLRAIRYFGGTAPQQEQCRKFVLSCLDEKSGGFANTPGGKPDPIVTAVGLMALVELKIPTQKYEKRAIAYMADNARSLEQVRMAAAGLEAVGKRSEKNREWLARLRRMQNGDGTFGKGKERARDTGGLVACVLRLGGKVKEPAAIRTALDELQRDDGGFGRADSRTSDLETTYRVMRTYHMLGGKPRRADQLRKFVARCRNSDHGYGAAPGLPSSAGGTYFAGIILHWLDEK